MYIVFMITIYVNYKYKSKTLEDILYNHRIAACTRPYDCAGTYTIKTSDTCTRINSGNINMYSKRHRFRQSVCTSPLILTCTDVYSHKKCLICCRHIHDIYNL